MQQPPWTSTQSGFVDVQQSQITKFANDPTFPKSIEAMDKLSFHYGRGDVNTDAALILHQSTQGELKERNSHGGANDRSMSRLLLIVIYQFWEDHYREGFAKAVGVDKNAIVSDIFGDIRRIRNDIIHHQNTATVDGAKCKLLKFFKPGDEIYLSSDQAKLIIQNIRKALDDLSQQFLGRDGGFAARRGGTGHARV